jgi:hypothetical protein
LILAMFSAYSVIIRAYTRVRGARRLLGRAPRGGAAAVWPLAFRSSSSADYGGVFSPTEAAAPACSTRDPRGRRLPLDRIADVYRTAQVTGLITACLHPDRRRCRLLLGDLVPRSRRDPGSIGIDQMGQYGVLSSLDRLLRRLHVRRPIASSWSWCRSSRGGPVGRPRSRAGRTIITLQVAIGSATPPFGCDIFTAIAIFKRPYIEVIRGTPPFIVLLLGASVALIFFPQSRSSLRDLAFCQ